MPERDQNKSSSDQSPWSTVTSLFAGIGILAEREDLLNPSAWSSLFKNPEEFIQSNNTSSDTQSDRKELDIIDYINRTFTKMNFSNPNKEKETPAESNPTITSSPTELSQQERQVPTQRQLQETAVIPPAPAQIGQERIKQLLTEKIKEWAPEPAAPAASPASPASLELTAPTPEQSFEDKVKNLTSIFLELKYQKIEEILQSAKDNEEKKIKDLKRFQGAFKLNTSILDEAQLNRAIIHLSSDIADLNLGNNLSTLTNRKFSNPYYGDNEIIEHFRHSDSYLKGILKDDEIDDNHKITAAKLFVEHLADVASSKNTDISKNHKKFVQFYFGKTPEAEVFTEIVASGTEFAKSIETESKKTQPAYKNDGAEGALVPNYFHDFVVKPEVEERDLVISKFNERLSKMSSLLIEKKDANSITKEDANPIFEGTIILCRKNLLTNKFFFETTSPKGAGASPDADAVDKKTAPNASSSNPAKDNSHNEISFANLSDEDIYRRSLYFRYVVDGIMEGKGNDTIKKIAIKFLIEEMSITTQQRFADENKIYNKHIKDITSDSSGNPIKKNDNVSIEKIKTIGKDFLKKIDTRVKDKDSRKILDTFTKTKDPNTNKTTYKRDSKKIDSSSDFAFFTFSDPHIDQTYKIAHKLLMKKDDEKIITDAGEIQKYIKAVQQFQRDAIKEILGQNGVGDLEKTQKIQAIFNLSLTKSASSGLKIKTTKGNLEKIEKILDDQKIEENFDQNKSILTQSYFNGLYNGALSTDDDHDDVTPEKKILGIRAIAQIERVAEHDSSFIDFNKIKQLNGDNANAIASGQAITRAIKKDNFDEKGEVKTNFTWKDTDEIDQAKLKEAYGKYLNKERNREKAEEEAKNKETKPGGRGWGCTIFACFRSRKPKETELTQDQKEKKTELLTLYGITPDTDTLKFKEPQAIAKNNVLYRITKATMDNILILEDDDKKLELLKKLMNLETKSVNDFLDGFAKETDLQVPSSNYTETLNIIESSNSADYFQKFCKAILDSREAGIGDEKKLEALKLFSSEQKNIEIIQTNQAIADENLTDDKIKTKAKDFLKAFSKAAKGTVVYSDSRIDAKMKELQSAAPDPTAGVYPAPAHATQAAAAAAAATTPGPAPAAGAAAVAARRAVSPGPAGADRSPNN